MTTIAEQLNLTDRPDDRPAIRVSPGQLSDCLTLRANSALHGCTDIDGDDAGVFITARYPRLSSGEELLWSVLAWLNGAPDAPSIDDLRSGLDEGNYTAALAALGVIA